MNFPWSTTRVGVVAGLAAGTAGLLLATGIGPAPALIASGAPGSGGTDDSATSTTVPTTITTSTASTGTPDTTTGAVRTVDAAGAGTVAVSVSGSGLGLVSAVPASGWSVEVEEDSGPEVEVDFRMGARRVQVDVELEDGAVRDRVRIRDEAAGADILLENGTVVRTGADRSGDGSADSVSPGTDGVDGHGTDDPGGDDHDTGAHHRGGHGTDDPAGDDHGGD